MSTADLQNGDLGDCDSCGKHEPMEDVCPDKATAKRLKDIHRLLGCTTTSPHIHDLLELVLATATSLPLCEGDHAAPIWLLIVGNPSSGKTETLYTLKEAKNVFWLDTLTENSFLSGYVEEGKNTSHGSNPRPQLLDNLDGQTLVIKDLTTLLSGKEEKVRKIIGELQSIYDGEYAKATGTVGVLRSESLFSLIACVTPVAISRHRQYMSLIGGRFLTYILPSLTDEERQAGFENCWAEETNREDNLNALRIKIRRHVSMLVGTTVEKRSYESPQVQQMLSQYSELLARGRGIVLTDKLVEVDEATGGERISYLLSAPQIEEPWRALQQLRTLARASCRVHGRKTVNEHDLALVRKVVFGSLLHDRADYLLCFQNGKETLAVKDFAERLSKPASSVRQTLQHLEILRLVERTTAVGALSYRPVGDLREVIVQQFETLDHEHGSFDDGEAA